VLREELPSPGEVVANHELVRVVGEGAMGVVFEAIAPDGSTVAIKLLKPEKAREPEAVAEFENEAKATGAVIHRNVVDVLGWGLEDGYHFIRMEFVDGPPLHRLLDEVGRIPWREASKTVIQVARALQCAHDRGLIHRDVKPDNILLYRDGRARLTDFGIVKDISSLKGFLLPAKRVGTALYASPEQCQGKRLTPATDQYSLGATFFRMVCGRPPFIAETASKVMVKHVKEPPPSPANYVEDLPKPLSNVIEKMLAKKVTDRYPEMERLIEDLILLVKGKVVIVPTRKGRRHR
jgi:serine/threonine-protein kinase